MRVDQEFLLATGYLFERERGVSHDLSEGQLIRDAGLQDAIPSEVADRVWSWLDQAPIEAWRGMAYWALGKRCLAEDRSRFVSALRKELPLSTAVAFQIMIALENIGEQVFSPERLGRSISEDEINRADAERYLRDHT